MQKSLFRTAILATWLAVGSAPAYAADETIDAIAEKLIKQLESSGALDNAIDRAIERRIQRDSEQRQKASREERTRQNVQAAIARKVDPKQDHLWGNADARISVIVYSDMECPFCKRFAGIPEAAAANIGPQVNVVWRHYPLEFHRPTALKEAYAAECVARQAGNEGFFNFANEILKRSNGNGQGLPDGDAGVLAIAKQAGVKNEQSFKSCLGEAQTAKRIDDDMKDGISAGITGTPGVIVRDNVSGHSGLVGGAIPQDQLEAQIRGLLSESQGN